MLEYEYYEYIPIIIVGIMNIVSGGKNIAYSMDVTICPIGIVKKYEPIGAAVFTLVYNLIFGGIIGVAGSIYYFIGVRSFVMKNVIRFEKEEKAYLDSRKKL